MTTTVYEQVLIITQDYLGPAAERFMNRQISTLLDKAPEELSKEDIPGLTEWMKLSIAILTEDKKLVENFAARLLEVGKN